jgi:hypothetical protein
MIGSAARPNNPALVLSAFNQISRSSHPARALMIANDDRE